MQHHKYIYWVIMLLSKKKIGFSRLSKRCKQIEQLDQLINSTHFTVLYM